MNDSQEKTEVRLHEQKLSHHEEVCSIRYNEIFRRLARLERIIWSFICASMSAFGIMLYHLITKIPGY